MFKGIDPRSSWSTNVFIDVSSDQNTQMNLGQKLFHMCLYLFRCDSYDITHELSPACEGGVTHIGAPLASPPMSNAVLIVYSDRSSLKVNRIVQDRNSPNPFSPIGKISNGAIIQGD